MWLDVVRASTREVAKIFQLLYDVEAVSGTGSGTYLGAINQTACISNNNGNMSGSSETLSRKIENSSIVNALLSSTMSNHLTDNESGIGSIGSI
jgi:hypothetical protein